MKYRGVEILECAWEGEWNYYLPVMHPCGVPLDERLCPRFRDLGEVKRYVEDCADEWGSS